MSWVCVVSWLRALPSIIACTQSMPLSSAWSYVFNSLWTSRTCRRSYNNPTKADFRQLIWLLVTQQEWCFYLFLVIDERVGSLEAHWLLHCSPQGHTLGSQCMKDWRFTQSGPQSSLPCSFCPLARALRPHATTVPPLTVFELPGPDASSTASGNQDLEDCKNAQLAASLCRATALEWPDL